MAFYDFPEASSKPSTRLLGGTFRVQRVNSMLVAVVRPSRLAMPSHVVNHQWPNRLLRSRFHINKRLSGMLNEP